MCREVLQGGETGFALVGPGGHDVMEMQGPAGLVSQAGFVSQAGTWGWVSGLRLRFKVRRMVRYVGLTWWRVA
jgi:hypothetical protein